MSVIDQQAAAVLDRAAKILATPDTWTKSSSARDAEGKVLERWDRDDAVCYCLGSAVDKAAHELFGENVLIGGPISHRADHYLAGLPLDASDDDANGAVVAFNDAKITSHQDVMARLAKAASAARAAA